MNLKYVKVLYKSISAYGKSCNFIDSKFLNIRYYYTVPNLKVFI